MQHHAFRPHWLRLAWGTCVALWLAPPLCAQTIAVPDVPGTTTAAVEVLVRGTWGTAPGQFGKTDEASRPGPMDFALTDDGLYVLDPVNARVQLFGWDGGFRTVVPIGTKTADFLTVDERGRIIVLDAFVRRELRIFSPDGKRIAQADLPDTLHLPSAVLAVGEHVYVEERHSRVYEVGIAGGAPARVLDTLPGRPLAARGAPIQAAKAGTHGVAIRTACAAGAEPLSLQFARPVNAIVGIESDERGHLYVAVTTPRDAARDAWKSDIVLAVIDSDGRLAGTLCLSDAYVTDHYRKLAVSRAGEIIQMQTTEDEVRFVRWTLPTTAAARAAL